MKDILSEIIANKRFEVDLQKQAISIEQLQEGISEMPSSRSMKQALISSSPGIIAEFKRRSPSKGWIKQEARPEEIAPAYAAAGASALSILTDEKFFGGNLKDIRAARPLVDIPILRKDFIIDEYQLYQAKIVGADAVLLIAAALKPEKCNELVKKAQRLSLRQDMDPAIHIFLCEIACLCLVDLHAVSLREINTRLKIHMNLTFFHTQHTGTRCLYLFCYADIFHCLCAGRIRTDTVSGLCLFFLYNTVIFRCFHTTGQKSCSHQDHSDPYDPS